MQNLQNQDLSNITVKVRAAHEHHWVSGQRLHSVPEDISRAVLLHQLWLVQEGTVEFRANDRIWKVEKGEVCFLPVTLERHILTAKPASWLSLRLWITVFNRYNPLQNSSLPIKWQPDELERFQMESWMEQIIRQHYMKAAHHGLVVEGLTRAVLGLCWPHLIFQSGNSSIHSELPTWLEQTLLRISTDLTCSVTDLAHEAGFSPAQFRRSFHRYVGSAPHDYLKTQRLEMARHLLEHTDLPLNTVAHRIGLKDVNHFAQTFKAAYGMAPTVYRASLHHD